MKRLVILSLAAALAFPLAADEPQKTAAAPQLEATTPADAAAVQATAAPATQADSPLVAASKRSGRRNKKTASKVITNETLKSSKGHITTTTNQRPVNVPVPKLTPEEEKLQEQKELAAHQAKVRTIGDSEKKKAEEEKQRKLAAAAASAEEGLLENLEDDPTTLEAAAEDASKKQKPPQH
jgi:hypothetical protein